MVKPENCKTLEELTYACNRMKSACEKYFYLWKEDDIWKKDNVDSEQRISESDKLLYLAYGWIAQDENFHIYITRKQEKFVFDGKNFCYDNKGYDALEAAKKINGMSQKYRGMDSESLLESFYESLKKPLGKYLANKEIEKIKLGGKNEISLA